MFILSDSTAGSIQTLVINKVNAPIQVALGVQLDDHEFKRVILRYWLSLKHSAAKALHCTPRTQDCPMLKTEHPKLSKNIGSIKYKAIQIQYKLSETVN